MAIRSFADGSAANTMALLARQNTLDMSPYTKQIGAGLQGIGQVAPEAQMRELLANTNTSNYQDNIGAINALAPRTSEAYQTSGKNSLAQFGLAGTLDESIRNNNLADAAKYAQIGSNELISGNTINSQENINKQNRTSQEKINEQNRLSQELIAGNNLEAKANAVTDDLFKTDYMQDANGNMQQIGITKGGQIKNIGTPMSSDAYNQLLGKSTGTKQKDGTWVVPSGNGKEPAIYYGKQKEGAIPLDDYTKVNKNTNTPEFLSALGDSKAQYVKNPTEWVDNELESMSTALNDENYLPRQVPEDLKKEYKNEIRSIVNNPEMFSKYMLLDAKGRIDMLNKNIGRNVKPSTLGALIYGMPDYEYEAVKKREKEEKANMYLNTGE